MEAEALQLLRRPLRLSRRLQLEPRPNCTEYQELGQSDSLRVSDNLSSGMQLHRSDDRSRTHEARHEHPSTGQLLVSCVLLKATCMPPSHRKYRKGHPSAPPPGLCALCHHSLCFRSCSLGQDYGMHSC